MNNESQPSCLRTVPAFCTCITFLLLLLVPPSYAADVYYIGAAHGTGPGGTAQSYTFKERLTDLVDFSADKSAEDRSGYISGRFLAEFAAQRVSGNKSKSFYSREGTDFNTELNLNVFEKLWSDYHLEGDIFLRKTDNPRIESRRDVRMKQLNVKVMNPDNLLEFGDFYGELSQFVLGSSLEGFHAKVGEFDSQEYTAIAARTGNADSTTATYQRNVFGAKAAYSLFQESALFSIFQLGAQVATVNDDSSTAPETATNADLKNTVFGIDGEIAFTKYLSAVFELARSLYVEDDDGQNGIDELYGTAFRFQPVLSLFQSAVNLRYLYYYVTPQFYTDQGSAAPDKEQHQWTLDLRLSRKASLSFVQNLYWDHLTKSSRAKRTINDEKYITLNLRPFDGRESFAMRTYVNHLIKNSDDAENTAEADTSTVGLSINDRIFDTSVGVFYEYRAYDAKYDPSTADYFNRFGANISRDFRVFGRRLYCAASVSNDIRNTKRDPDKDANAAISFNGQYDAFDRLTFRFGHNIQTANSSGPGNDYRNLRSFIESDLALLAQKKAHLVTRYEYNRYDHETGTQDYNEQLVSTKFILTF